MHVVEDEGESCGSDAAIWGHLHASSSMHGVTLLSLPPSAQARRWSRTSSNQTNGARSSPLVRREAEALKNAESGNGSEESLPSHASLPANRMQVAGRCSWTMSSRPRRRAGWSSSPSTCELRAYRGLAAVPREAAHPDSCSITQGQDGGAGGRSIPGSRQCDLHPGNHEEGCGRPGRVSAGLEAQGFGVWSWVTAFLDRPFLRC